MWRITTQHNATFLQLLSLWEFIGLLTKLPRSCLPCRLAHLKRPRFHRENQWRSGLKPPRGLLAFELVNLHLITLGTLCSKIGTKIWFSQRGALHKSFTQTERTDSEATRERVTSFVAWFLRVENSNFACECLTCESVRMWPEVAWNQACRILHILSRQM